MVSRAQRDLFAKTLLIHASDLPIGRGWSPAVWQILEGRTQLTLTLLEAEDDVDSGAVWRKIQVDVPRHFLCSEINAAIFEAELTLMDFAIEQFGKVEPERQPMDIEATFYRKRSPTDSRINPDLPIAAQFDLIRVSDPTRYPAFFDLHGHRYKIILEKHENN
jgi:methionyl-tRNA formyltransferase